MKETLSDDEEEEINTSSNINNIIMEKKLNKNSYVSMIILYLIMKLF